MGTRGDRERRNWRLARPGWGRRAFLLVELLMGLVIVAMVMLGGAAIMSSVAEGWNDQDVTKSTQLHANQIYARIQSALAGAKYVGYCNAGSVDGTSSQPGCIVFWQNDNYGGVEAGEPRYGEMAVIQQDPTTNSLYLYETMPSLNAAEETLASTATNWAEISASTFPASFEQASFVQQVALGGPGSQPTSATQLNVEGFQVYVSSLGSTTQLPIIEYAVGLSQGGVMLPPLYSSTTLHGPTSQPQ